MTNFSACIRIYLQAEGTRQDESVFSQKFGFQRNSFQLILFCKLFSIPKEEKKKGGGETEEEAGEEEEEEEEERRRRVVVSRKEE